MNRRKFLFSSAVTALGLAAWPKAVRAQTTGIEEFIENDVTAGGTRHTIKLNRSAVNNFSAATASNKNITLIIEKLSDTGSVTSKTEHNYTIDKVSVAKKDASMKDVYAKFESNVSGEMDKKSDYKKGIYLTVGSGITTINTKKGEINKILTLKAPNTNKNDGGGGCFLTTACVQHKNLADDCEELTALRLVRDSYMATTPGGQQLIKEYKIIGPQIVTAINSANNASEIYNYMYSYMIAPSVQMVKAGEYAQAVNHYKNCVSQLKEAYC